MICEHHNRYIPDGQVCSDCFREENDAKKKAEKEAGKTFGRHKKFQLSDSSKSRKRLKDKLQGLVSEYVKTLYKSKGVYYDWITGKANYQAGLFGLHAAHYYPKGELWQLWCDPVNIGLTDHNHNVNKPETAPMMRRMMIEVHGAEAILDLDRRAEDYKLRIQAGIDPRHPEDLWLVAMAKEMKAKIKNLKK